MSVGVKVVWERCDRKNVVQIQIDKHNKVKINIRSKIEQDGKGELK
jgi:hypothetical protein